MFRSNHLGLEIWPDPGLEIWPLLVLHSEMPSNRDLHLGISSSPLTCYYRLQVGEIFGCSVLTYRTFAQVPG